MFDTATKTLGVNGAFLQEIKQDHVELHALLGKTERALRLPSVDRKPRELVYLLFALQHRLAIHFALEEEYGYFEDALEVAPRLSSQAEALRAEHKELFAEVCHLADEAEQLLAEQPDENSSGMPRSLCLIASNYELFRQALEEHERREMELILCAFDDDLGVGD